MASAAVQPSADQEQPDQVDPAKREAMILEAAHAICGRLAREAQKQVASKQLIEERWIEDLRAYHGIYDPDILKSLSEAKRSTAFVKITRHKTSGWAARLNDLLFPTDERNWGIDPTPVPSLVKAAKQHQQAAAAAVEQANSTADQADATAQQDPQQAAQLQQRAQVTKQQADSFAQAAANTEQEIAEAKARCERMQEAIEDQFVESSYPAQCRDVIEDGCKLGSGILKGPMTSPRLRAEWRKNPEGGYWELAQIPDQPIFVRVDPWHFFPDMSAQRISDAEFTFERSLPTKKDLRRYAKKLGFNPDAVRRLLDQGPGEVTGTDLTFLQNLRDMTGEGDAITGRYVMWEYHGPLECEDICSLLRAAGREDDARSYEMSADPLDEHRVIIHFCNHEALKIAPEYPLDSGDSLYSVWNFEKGETSVFGVGVPYIMRDSQRAVNGAWRMMMDNSGLSVGPQVLIDKNSVVPEDGDWGLRPLKVWLKSSTALHSPNNKPFEVFDIPNNQQALAGIIELGQAFADEETSLPQLAQGEQGQASATLGGMSMLFNSANVMFRRVVKSWDDDLTAPTLRRAYDWNMQFNPDESVKGDMQVEARGTSVLLVREIQSAQLMNIVQNWTSHPVLGFYVKVRESASKALQTLMLKPDDVLKTDDEANTARTQSMQAQQQAMQAQVQAEAQAKAAARAPPPASPAAPDNTMEIAVLEANTRIHVAEIERDKAMAALAVQEKMSIADVQAKFGIKQAEIASKERLRAVDIAVENQRAKTAVAEGEPAAAATGTGVG